MRLTECVRGQDIGNESVPKIILNDTIDLFFSITQCFDAVGWAAGRASGL